VVCIAAWLALSLSTAACGDDFVEGIGSATDGETTATTAADTLTGADVTGTSGSMPTDSAASATATGDTTGTATDSASDTTTGGSVSASATDTTATDTDTGTSGGTDTDGDTDTDTDTGEPCMVDADCDDGVFCNGNEACVAGACEAGTPPQCDDGVDCTTDACDENAQGCAFIEQDQMCQNGDFCDGAELCDAQVGCVAGNPVMCDDAIDCTEDSCDEVADECSFVADDVQCQNGSVCDGTEICSLANGCQPGPAPDCNDFIPCTVDTCDDMQGGCVNAPDDLACDNGVYCDGEEFCDAQVGCTDGPVVDCGDDQIACTVETCNEAQQVCESIPDNGLCGQGQFCVPAADGCVDSPPCNNDAQCDDGNACNGVETCNVTCQPGMPVACSDGVSCTVDSCDPQTGTCSNVAVDTICDDGEPCNGAEVCDESLGCTAGAPPSCDDQIDCTVDTCIPNFGCFNAIDHDFCDDGAVCNGAEICDEQLDCQPAAQPVQCGSDGFACTSEFCDEDEGGCVSVADDDLCACGETCNPDQSQDASGCSDVCNVALCEGKVYQCGNCLDDDMDCSIDSFDPECFGPCDNNESGFKGEIPGQNNAPCKQDCYFDGDSGSGNDDCYWSHECDPLEPTFPTCEYDPNANIPGSSMSCDEAYDMQSLMCEDVCGPITPNGCDCFGCCEVFVDDDTSVTVYLGTEDDMGDGSCNMANVQDPMACAPCTQVQGCLNTCENCELCFGQTELPPECTEQDCEGEQQLCGQPGQQPCPAGGFCVTGCCVFF
jgi:hypothetical protein